MFYSHQLLARKAPLGQIWMAATMRAKMNRRKLDKLDIIKICEEILNPSVPMALRLSGILMGGVVIVYERKVKLLYDDVTRFLVEINAAWKVKTVSDPTVLPRAKAQAKFEAVTLPEYVDMEPEQPMMFPDASIATAAFQRMRLDDLEEHYINIDLRDDDLAGNDHQAEPENITLFETFGSGVAETDLYNHFERFDVGDDETHINFTPQEEPQFEATLIPSLPHEDEIRTFTHLHSAVENHQTEEKEEQRANAEDVQRQQPVKRKAHRKPSHRIMDDRQLMIPGNIYQLWLQDTSDIVSKRGRTQCLRSVNPIRSTKISNLMDLPPVALISGLEMFPAKVHYPSPLMELWRKCTEVNISPSGDKSPPAQQREVTETLLEEVQGEIGSNSLDVSIEKLRANLENLDFQGFDDAFSMDHFVTPGSSAGQSSKSMPSSGSGHAFMQLEPEIQLPSVRSKRKQHSSSKSFRNLDPVEEELPLQQDVRGSKIRRLSETGPTPDFELEETGPTQTPVTPPSNPAVDNTTLLIRTHLKLHFDTPGAPQSESLNQLAFGMYKRKAAQLFYQTCVLVTCDFIKVQQHEAYGDISISRGPKM
ncbi:sister chromatid cohesion 1 protein 1 [Musa acuminata AAA Group]|uniref:sister chromatid cohesion 1 protein 1 n=1 Tax=Musa acuminata AAA Group TaxID=214697 RepID=UPI0031D46626